MSSRAVLVWAADGLARRGLPDGPPASGDDIRGRQLGWPRFCSDCRRNPEFIERGDAVEHGVTVAGRPCADAVLRWISARHHRPIHLLGPRTPDVADNVGALCEGLLAPEIYLASSRIRGREGSHPGVA